MLVNLENHGTYAINTTLLSILTRKDDTRVYTGEYSAPYSERIDNVLTRTLEEEVGGINVREWPLIPMAEMRVISNNSPKHVCLMTPTALQATSTCWCDRRLLRCYRQRIVEEVWSPGGRTARLLLPHVYLLLNLHCVLHPTASCWGHRVFAGS